MTTTPGSAGADSAGTGAESNIAAILGLKPGMVVQELGWDDDSDDDVRAAVEELVGEEMVDENSDEIVEAILLWYRQGDGDLVDILVDAIAPLADNGFIWLLTPKRGRPGYVEPSDIAEAAPTAGLAQTSLATVGIGLGCGPPGGAQVARRASLIRRSRHHGDQVGDLAPDFTLRDQNNEQVTLSRFRGQKAVLVIFYPLAFTGICTGELCTVRDDLATFQNDDDPDGHDQRRLALLAQDLRRTRGLRVPVARRLLAARRGGEGVRSVQR